MTHARRLGILSLFIGTACAACASSEVRFDSPRDGGGGGAAGAATTSTPTGQTTEDLDFDPGISAGAGGGGTLGSDTDQDGDGISDAEEGYADPDQDGIPSYLDLDSDGDCILDSAEAGDDLLETPAVDSDGDGAADFHDLDSDGDGLADGAEDLDCDGLLDPGETSPLDQDSDGDGASDLIEVSVGTDPSDPNDNPEANGDVVFVVPLHGDATIVADDLVFASAIRKVDVYVMVDRSGSMAEEIASIESGIQQAASQVTCPPLGEGVPGQCIPDIWWGAGSVGYASVGGEPYGHHLDLQPDPTAVSSSIPSGEPDGCCDEPLLAATWSVCTGAEAIEAGCVLFDPYPARHDCSGSPAGESGFGYPCFRAGALPVILLATDEPLTQGYSCPGIEGVAAVAQQEGVKVIGIKGATGDANVQADLEALAIATGAVDPVHGDAPLVIDGADGQAAAAIEQALALLAGGLPMNVGAVAVDDPSDSVDAVAAFVDHLETLQLGTPSCSAGLDDADTDADGFADSYLGVPAATPVCWRLAANDNDIVAPSEEPQVFHAVVEIRGDGVRLLDSHDLYFVVPPAITELTFPDDELPPG